MTETLGMKSKPGYNRKGAVARLFVLELSRGRIESMNPDGSDRNVIVTHCRLPDGIAVDVEAGQIYWTNMGSSPSANDGSIERADIDGNNRTVVVPPGGTFTPKQIQIDKKNGKLYWCDREGMRVMRSNLDGSQIETRIGATKPGGASGSPSTPSASRFTGHKKARTTESKADSFAPGSKSLGVRPPPTAPTSRYSSITYRSRSISSSISKIACSTGRTAATRRAVTP
jgi:DNA-binding beta-propeller fold protein YncE